MPKDFSKEEINIINKAIATRWQEMDIHLADIEIARSAKDEKTIPCPAVVWETADCTFVVAKVDELAYKSVFYYMSTKQIDTGVNEFNDLQDCVITLMKVQSNFILSSASPLNNNAKLDIKTL